jgi:protein-S-isoprenylcysteine O-methyltransferase Ste14
MRWIKVDEVGLPGIAAFTLGLMIFFILLLLANWRRGREPSDGTRMGGSWSGVVLQGLGIGVVSFGPVIVRLDPLSPVALIEAGVTALLMAITCWLFLASSRAMGKNWAVVARTRSDHQLVTTGPFAIVRNPIYDALFLLMLAFALSYGHWRNLVVSIPLYVLGTWIRITREERLLRGQFGASYDAYALRVKRFVPGVF